MTTALPITPPLVYNESWKGVYGEFGSGAGLRAMYLLTAVSPANLDKISLLEEIRGSERWQVRDLFQREVDKERVTGPLMDYLRTEDRVRFFNPLTLTVLPMDEHGSSVLERMPKVVEDELRDGGFDWRVFERPGYYRMRHVRDQPDYGQIDWNEKTSRIVAIDGQHRLSALKRRHALPGPSADPFHAWRIPVVVVSFRAGVGRAEPPGVLEVVRSIFVDINTEAREVNEARKILLNDRSVNCLATQELLEVAHSNDLKPLKERRQESLPLLFFDWRGQEKAGVVVPSPAAVKTIGELQSWFEWYLLDEDFTSGQVDALGLRGKPLGQQILNGRLTFRNSWTVRKQVRQAVIPALLHVLENFDPYRRYVAGLRNLELRHYTGNDVQHHAFDCLRFGTSYATGPTEELVLRVLPHIEGEVEKLKKKHLPWPLDHDVGPRGIVGAFGWLRWELGEPHWLEFSEWFTGNLNRLYAEGWLSRERGRKGAEFLRHVVFDHTDNIVNYRLKDARKALAAYVSLLVGSYGPPPATWPNVRVYLLEQLNGTLVRGYKREHRLALKVTYPDGGKPLTDAVNEAARKSAGKQIRRFERELERLEAAAAAGQEATVGPDGG